MLRGLFYYFQHIFLPASEFFRSIVSLRLALLCVPFSFNITSPLFYFLPTLIIFYLHYLPNPMLSFFGWLRLSFCLILLYQPRLLFLILVNLTWIFKVLRTKPVEVKIILHLKCPILKWSVKVWIHATADLNFTELLRSYTHTAPQSGSLPS